MHIIPPENTDIEALAQLEKQEYGDEGYPSDFFYQVASQWPGYLVLAREGQSILGYALFSPGVKAQQSWLMSLLVCSSARGTGTGKALLQASIDKQRQYGVKEIWLSVAPDNKAAITLYQKQGFTIDQLQSDYLGPGQHRYLMRCLI